MLPGYSLCEQHSRGWLACSLVEVGPVIRALDMDPPHTLDPFALFILIQVVGAACGTTSSLQKCIVGASAILSLIQQNIQGFLINAGLRELHLCSQKMR